MIVEERNYTVKLAHLPEFWALYSKEGLAIQRRILGNLVGYYSTETGELNVVVHLWAYENYADREERRRKLAADPAWQAYQKKRNDLGLIVKQESRILRSAQFFTPILKAMMAAAPAP